MKHDLWFSGAAVAALIASTPLALAKGVRQSRGCPDDMVSIGQYCIDRYEAYVAEVLPGGKLRKHSPFKPIGEQKKIKALNRRGRMPQAYINRDQAEQACKSAGKRLCTDEEWVGACKGKKPTTWPYGDEWKPGRCNDSGVSSFNMLFGEDGHEPPLAAYSFENLNDSRLNKAKGTCAPSGRFKKCRNGYRVYDMVGNLHEWTSASDGTFRGGYFLDVRQNGEGCNYKTGAHAPKYHDYSTGFRCCSSSPSR
jgi:formylglycine-generating enzyme required for sulfatase activity